MQLTDLPVKCRIGKSHLLKFALDPKKSCQLVDSEDSYSKEGVSHFKTHPEAFRFLTRFKWSWQPIIPKLTSADTSFLWIDHLFLSVTIPNAIFRNIMIWRPTHYMASEFLSQCVSPNPFKAFHHRKCGERPQYQRYMCKYHFQNIFQNINAQFSFEENIYFSKKK